MDEYKTPPSGAAQELLDNQHLSDLLDELEGNEMRAAVSGGFDDHDARTIASIRFDAYQTLRSELARQAAGVPAPAPKSGRA